MKLLLDTHTFVEDAVLVSNDPMFSKYIQRFSLE